jgi:ketosteroid isomerase-like protein
MTAIPSKEVIARFNEGFECWNRGDLDEMMDDYRPDAVVDWSEATVDEAPRRGWKQIRDYYDHLFEFWAGVRMDPVEVIQAGEDRFVVVVRLWGQSKPSGIQVEQQFAMLYSIRDDKVFRLTVYPHREAALEAASAAASERVQ